MSRRSEHFNRLLRRLLPGYEPYAFMVDHRKGEPGEEPATRHKVWAGFFVCGLPRLMLRCRVLGHRPVVDGQEPQRVGGYLSQAYLWVACSRCRVRAWPQGSLDPTVYRIGQRYTGEWDHRSRQEHDARVREWKLDSSTRPLLELPGRIDEKPTGQIGAELVVGGANTGLGFEIKIGSHYSEHTLACNVRLGWLGALYLHTERFGDGLAWLLNRGEQSRLIGLTIGGGYRTFCWDLWAKRWRGHESSVRQRWWWQHVDVHLRPIDRLLGRKLYSYTAVGEPAYRMVRMPERDYLVKLTLQQQTHGRRRQLRKRKVSWTVSWDAVAAGVPTKPRSRARL